MFGEKQRPHQHAGREDREPGPGRRLDLGPHRTSARTTRARSGPGRSRPKKKPAQVPTAAVSTCAGLLFAWPPQMPGCPAFSSPTTSLQRRFYITSGRRQRDIFVVAVAGTGLAPDPVPKLGFMGRQTSPCVEGSNASFGNTLAFASPLGYSQYTLPDPHVDSTSHLASFER